MQSWPMAKGDTFSVSLPRGKGLFIVAQCSVQHAKELCEGIWGIGAIFTTSGPQGAAGVRGRGAADLGEDAGVRG